MQRKFPTELEFLYVLVKDMLPFYEKMAIFQEEWDDFDDDIIVNCINSMPNRIIACIDAEGVHTKY